MKILDKDLESITLRKEQAQALNFTFDTIQKDSNIKNILLDLPTGVGKSILALKFAQRYLRDINPKANFDFITNSKILQEQYFEEFDSLSNLWGKNNYTCDKYDCSCETGKEMNKINKDKCETCPYDKAKSSYLSSKLNLTNYHLYIMLNMYQEDIMKMREKNVLIIDEAHELEEVFSEFISISLSENKIKKLGLKNATSIIKSLKSIKTLESFIDFAEEFLLYEMSDKIGELNRQLNARDKMNPDIIKRDIKLQRAFDEPDKTKILKDEVSMYKNLNELSTFTDKIKSFILDYNNMPENWVMEIDYTENKQKVIQIKPVWAHPYLDKYIWSRYDHIIMMSGTILDKDMFSYLNGLSPHQTAYYSIDSPFEIQNRPIYYMPVGKMTFTKKEETFKKYVPFLNKLLAKYKGKKGIFHTHTYEIANWVKGSIQDDRLLFHETDSKERALKIHYSNTTPSVLVSPSMTTGVDLADDRARFQVILKVPYPSLASKKNKIRNEMKGYYAYKTISTIIQMYGRAVRNYKDKADTIILDGSFTDLMTYNSSMFPKWVSGAIKRVDAYKVINK